MVENKQQKYTLTNSMNYTMCYACIVQMLPYTCVYHSKQLFCLRNIIPSISQLPFVTDKRF